MKKLVCACVCMHVCVYVSIHVLCLCVSVSGRKRKERRKKGDISLKLSNLQSLVDECLHDIDWFGSKESSQRQTALSYPDLDRKTENV